MSRFRPPRRPSPATLLALVAVVLAATGVATGATRPRSSETKKIVACVDRDTGVVRIREKSRCAKDERRVAWNQVGPAGRAGDEGPAGSDGASGSDGVDGSDGAEGAEGAPGSALAYGHVNVDGTLDAARSKNVSVVTKLSGSSAGVFCVALDVEADNVIATLDGNVGDSASARPILRASLTVASGCPAGTDFTVRIVEDGSSVAKPFFLAVN